VIDDLQAIAEALGLVHEMRGEEDRLPCRSSTRSFSHIW
jgi:hypothetical protein